MIFPQTTPANSLQPSEDRWYEDPLDPDHLRESPPPLPARLQSQLTKQRKENGEILTMAKKWKDRNHREGNGDKVQKERVTQGKKWPVEGDNLHAKVQTSHSLPLNHAGFSLPVATSNGSSAR